jgi:hypothetical protein
MILGQLDGPGNQPDRVFAKHFLAQVRDLILFRIARPGPGSCHSLADGILSRSMDAMRESFKTLGIVYTATLSADP